MVLTIAALMTGQHMYAESTWEVTNDNGNSNTFTIKRSEKGYVQKVLYRTVSLSAYAGQHFTAQYGELEFLADDDEKTVTVTEKTPSTDAYKYQNGAKRKYGFEVTDRAGYRLAYAERSKTWGTSVPSSGIFDTKDVVINSGEITVTAAGYAQGYHSMTVNDYFNNAAPSAYLQHIGAELRMTLSFDAKEVDDGWQYVQIYANQSTTNIDTGAGDGNPGSCSYAKYVAGFEHKHGSKDAEYKSYSFPVTSAGNDAGATNPWGHGTGYNLHKQLFNDSRDSDGRLIIPTNLTSLYVRYNASGSVGDDWVAKNTVAHIQAIDLSYPSRIAMTANPGRHAKGNTFYVSVALSEIVTSTNATLTTSWGKMTLEAGSGTNVLTFKGTIKADASDALNVTSWSGDITDLSGRDLNFLGFYFFNQDNLATLDGDLAYTLSDFQQQGGNYLITCHDDLRGLAGYVNGGNNSKDLTFLQVTDLAFPHSDVWSKTNSTENNYTAIGDYSNPFQGTYDGGDCHTISGIRIYKGDDRYQGLFGEVGKGGTVKRVNLADTRITGYSIIGGIAGQTSLCTIEDCTVGSDVCIHAVQNTSLYHGGIVGDNFKGLVRRCISSARLTVKNGVTGCGYYGGIAGKTYGTITDCIANGTVIPDVNARGAILGLNEDNAGTLTRNYYHNCTVAGVANATDVGQGTYNSTATSDVDGARDLYAITLPEYTTLVLTPEATLPGSDTYTYTNGATIDGTEYFASGCTVTLTVPTGFRLANVTVNGTAATDNGDGTWSFTMPAEDATVTATVSVPYIDADGNEQQCTDFTFIESSSDTYNYYGTSGQTNWYVVKGNVTIGGELNFKDSHSHLIVCDGATLTINSSNGGIYNNYGSVTIYGQTAGSGSINANTEYSGIDAYSSVTINGCTVNASGNYGIKASTNTVTINRGNVNATGTSCDGIYAYYDIILGWSSPNDRITASSYAIDTDNGGTVKVKDGQTLTDGTDVYQGTLTDDEIAAIAGKELKPAIPYVDTGGRTQYCLDYTLVRSSDDDVSLGSSDNAEGWYVVSGDVTITGKLSLEDQAVHLILCDGATLTVSSSDYPCISVYYNSNADLTIYGQTLGTGTAHLTATDGFGIYSSGGLTITGGIINATATGNTAIYSQKNVTITGGSVTATGSNGIRVRNSNGNIYLGWRNASDRIKATDYTCANLVIIAGQSLTDGTDTYSGTLTDAQRSAIAGKTLNPAGNVPVPYIDADGKDAILAADGFTLITSNSGDVSYGDSGNAEAWYVVSGSVTIGGRLTLQDQCANIVLCDNATLTVSSGSDAVAVPNGNVNIFVQSGASGTANLTATADGITATGSVTLHGGTVTVQGSEHGISATAVTLGCHTTANRITVSSYNGTVTVKSGQTLADGSSAAYNGTLTAEQVSAIAGKTLYLGIADVLYIDGDGKAQVCPAAIPVESSDKRISLGNGANTEDWYVVNGDVTINGSLWLNDQAAYLILCDGATLTINYDGLWGAIDANGSLTLYGQSEGTGSVVVTNTHTSASYGIEVNHDLTIHGGNVSASGNNTGIYANNITLGWSNPASHIYASRYLGTVKVKDGQAYTDDTDVYYGTLTDDQRTAIAGKTLQPYGVTVSMNSSGIRTYASPYDLDMSAVDAYVISAQSGEKLTLTPVTEAPANTGLLLKAKDDSQKGTTVVLPLKENAAAVGTNLLKPVLSSETIVPQTDGAYTNFILANGAHGIDWYTLSYDGAIGANKAYLQLLTANLPSLSRGFTWEYQGGTTSLTPVPSPIGEGSDKWYTLSGMRLSGKPTKKGVYIHNGIKIVIR